MNWYLRMLIAEADKGVDPTANNTLMERLKQESHQWGLKDLQPNDVDRIYNINKDSYEKGSTGESFTKDRFVQRANGWTFYGDKNMTGYVTGRVLSGQLSGVFKLTGMSGSKKGIMAGMAMLMEGNMPIFGAVTDDIFSMATKRGFQTLDPESLKLLVKFAPQTIWGYAESKPTVGPDGSLSIHMPDFNKYVTKKFICNTSFKTWLDNMKNKMSMFGKMY